MSLQNSASPCCLPPSAPAKDEHVLTPWAGGARRSFEGQLISLQGGEFLMGEDRPVIARIADGEGPVRSVAIAPFEISATTVTVAQFAAFIEATGYRTSAEDFGWSYVFHRHLSAEARKHARGFSSEVS